MKTRNTQYRGRQKSFCYLNVDNELMKGGFRVYDKNYHKQHKYVKRVHLIYLKFILKAEHFRVTIVVNVESFKWKYVC